MNNFMTLVSEARNCTLCEKHLPLGPRPVFQIHPDAKILIAGQAPGTKVHASGIPFDDASGNRLREWLGIDKATFYNPEQFAIVPMGFCYPGKGKSGDLPPRPECAETWRKPLLEQLEQLQLIIVVGKYAMDYHLGKTKKNLTEQVLDWQDYWPEKLLLPHPSPRNNIWLKKNPWFETDRVPAIQQRVKQILDA
ncbi:uracil-DNA glycosylase family protein [Oceanicoccus sagamiensis]|uniref:Uracil-DNA glycosylase-like domain-containing protein n=1 Tax=Oceanicoccus sagamiensis TaxID=716816 RepID=A0A1X9NAU7_9GAMM|nr:uracil-DNA glycosylase family protein [Oceanicoccus sagamiensis]ARN75170.1 hypothetical protein BST96_14225 [Oceanicoccus sagamiensis]